MPHVLQGLMHDQDRVVDYSPHQDDETQHRQHVQRLRRLVKDKSPIVRVVAAEALGRYGKAEDRQRARSALLKAADIREVDGYTAIAALNAIDALGDAAEPMVGDVGKLPVKDPRIKRGGAYLANLVRAIVEP